MNILVIGPSWVGDMMMSHALYQQLKVQYPDCQIDVMAPDWCRPLLARMPEVRKAISMPIGHGAFRLGERFQLGKSLRNQYDMAIVLPNSLKSALIPLFANKSKIFTVAKPSGKSPYDWFLSRSRVWTRKTLATLSLCKIGGNAD